MSPLLLDHVSLAVADAPQAWSRLHRYGLQVTPTPTAAPRHGRLHLDRAYLEVSERGGAEPGRWTAPLFFFRFEDRPQQMQVLAGRGLQARPRSYLGVDGEWEELEVDAPPEVRAPVLVRRVSPPELARSWPPRLEQAHRCGARTLERVYLACADLAAAAVFFERLLGAPSRPGGVTPFGASSVDVGPLSLVDPPTPGPAPAPSPGPPSVCGVALGTDSVEHTAQWLSERAVPLARAEQLVWVDPADSGGMVIAFTSAADAGHRAHADR